MTWLRNFLTAIGARLKQFGLLEDEALDVATGGPANETVSIRAETAAENGSKFWAFVCAVLSVLIQPDHCAKQRAGLPMPPVAYAKAAFWITVMMVLMAGLVWLAADLFRHACVAAGLMSNG